MSISFFLLLLILSWQGLGWRSFFSFILTKILKGLKNKLWQTVLVLRFFPWISLDWSQGLRHLKKGLIQFWSFQFRDWNIIPLCLNTVMSFSFRTFFSSLVIKTFMKSWRGYIFFAVCMCVCTCVCVCQWTKFQRTECTDLEAVFAKWLLTALARTLWNWWPWVKGQGYSDVIHIFSS